MRVLHHPEEQVLDHLVEAYLVPLECWFVDFYDRRRHAVFTTATRHYLEIDEPGRPMDPALDGVLARWERGDPDLLIVPKSPHEERAGMIDAFIETHDGPIARALGENCRRHVRGNWRPRSLFELTQGLDDETRRAWLRCMDRVARPAVTRWLEANDIVLDGAVTLVFD